MCGLVGFLDPHQRFNGEEARHRLNLMSLHLRHRGPDGDGARIESSGNGRVWGGLAHRRLSILDLSPTGEQPMRSHCGRYIIAFNGEIYNFREIRDRLDCQASICWRGTSDTEVLLELISRVGVRKALGELDGMFAFALLDRETRTISLVRDAFGEKPLVYGLWDGVLLFGSELGALRAWSGFTPREDPAARAAMMQYACIPAPLTIYEGIFKLPPAHMLVVTSKDVRLGELPPPGAWWEMTAAALAARQAPFEDDFEAAVGAVETAFSRSVARRLVSDVPLGALLSGGIDSSLTTVFMQRSSQLPVRSFTIGMEEEGYDESVHAAAVASHLGTQHEALMLSPADVLEEVPKIAGRYDEPFADSSQLPTYLLSRMARGHVTVALSGDGGDELFAGYNRHFHGPRLWSILQHFPLGLRGTAGKVLGAFPPAVLTALIRVAGSLAPRDLATGRAGEKLLKLARLLGARDRDAFYDALLRTGHAGAVLLNETDGAPVTLTSDPRLAELDFGSASMIFDTGHYLHEDVLTKVDRASMAVSLEIRTPFLNRELFDLAWRLPDHFKADGRQGKRVLRELLYRHVPREIVDRPKVGFAMPIGRWLRGPLADWAESHLSINALRTNDVFDVGKVRAIWNAHLSGRRDHETQLWSVLMYQAWKTSQQNQTHYRGTA